MRYISYLLVFVVIISALSACSNSDPGPIAGTWQIKNPIMPMIFQFRSGETESMGIIEKVSYKVDGNSVIVTSKDGMAKGISMRYELIDKDTLRAGGGLMHRIK